jgi:hypothetical protein
MTQKICFDCFRKLFPDKPIRKVTLGRQCVVCKAQTDRTEQMIPVEAEDIPLVKQILTVGISTQLQSTSISRAYTKASSVRDSHRLVELQIRARTYCGAEAAGSMPAHGPFPCAERRWPVRLSGGAATGLLNKPFGRTWIIDICEFGVSAVAWALPIYSRTCRATRPLVDRESMTHRESTCSPCRSSP